MKPKRIGINAVFLDPKRMGGAETYTRFLIDELHGLDVADEFVIFAAQGHEFRFNNPRFKLVTCPVDPGLRKLRILWEQAFLTRLIKQHDVDLMHFPYSSFPYKYRDKCVVSIHDTMRIAFPQLVPWLERTYRRTLENRLARLGHHVICVSQVDGAVFAQSTGIPSSHISVIHYGNATIAANRSAVLPDSMRLQQGYVLWYGRPYAHKNVESLIAAYGGLRKTWPDVPRLRLVGMEENYLPHFRKAVQAAGVEDCVTLEPPIPHDQIVETLANALLLVYPSSYESFGLPVLEAKALGVPVLCSRHPAFVELHSDTIAYADVESPQAFARQLEKLLTDTELRKSLAERGRADAARFTWPKCARETYALYQRLLDATQ